MAFSKVIFNGQTLMDVTQDTVTADALALNAIATGADGEKVTGTMSASPIKLIDESLSNNWIKISIVSIDYSTGVITLDNNDAPFTESYSTTVRVLAVPLIEGYAAPFKYGWMPNEIWQTSLIYYGVLVGTNQIKLYKSDSASIDAMTDSGSIDLTRWQIWAEKRRNSTVTNVSVTDIDKSHRYRIRMFFPNGMCHKTSGYTIKDDDGQSYGDGYSRGYLATGPASEGSSSNIRMTSTLNAYETVSLRGVHYGYLEQLYCRLPVILTGELYRLSEQSWALDASYTFGVFWTNTPTAAAKPTFTTIQQRIFLNSPPKTIQSNWSGNSNTCPDGARFTVWDLGEEY